ncbi:hypothetical protein ASF87_10295 [Microbacterium sp. Leaf161]|nr:hypothetical protein ASF87_10295 [Microbacterium sp. Leaf161]
MEVDQVDSAALAVGAFDHVALDFVELQYSDAGAGDLYVPVSYVLSGTLPEGLSLDPSTGRISGTTTQTGSFPLSVEIADAAGVTTTGAYTLTVAPLVVGVPSAPPVDDPVGPDNSTWVPPADTEYVTWVEEDGELIAVAQPGVVFENGETRINFGIAPDNHVEPGPAPEPEPEPESGVVDPSPAPESGAEEGALASTGVDIAGLLIPAGIGIAAVGMGTLLAMLRVRRRA